MNKYTFIFEYNKGTYISQYITAKLEEAIYQWACTADIPSLNDEERDQLIKEINEGNETPTSIDGVDNVWCLFLRIGKKSHLLNIVQTI
jgi:hypothetical protein